MNNETLIISLSISLYIFKQRDIYIYNDMIILKRTF